MSLLLRPVSAEDFERLEPLDSSYAARFDCEPVVDVGSLSFYARSGHSFLAQEDGETVGFLLAQAVWDGRRPTVMIRRLASSSAHVARALLEVVTKSAYDSGVYDLVAQQPEADGGGERALADCSFRPRAVKLYSRILGSRSVNG